MKNVGLYPILGRICILIIRNIIYLLNLIKSKTMYLSLFKICTFQEKYFKDNYLNYSPFEYVHAKMGHILTKREQICVFIFFENKHDEDMMSKVNLMSKM